MVWWCGNSTVRLVFINLFQSDEFVVDLYEKQYKGRL